MQRLRIWQAAANTAHVRSTLSGRWVWLLWGALVWVPQVALARSNGLAVTDCTGCHAGSGNRPATVSLSANPLAPQPGQTVRLMVSVSGGSAAGLYLRTNPSGVGTLAVVSGQSTKLADGGLVHSTPKAALNGTTTFLVDWTAPASPGDVELFAYALAVNRDGNSTGDSFGTGYLSFAFGCAGKPYYPDYDLDGYGEGTTPRIACTQPDSYAPESGDCDNYDAKLNPGVTELCNGKDDNCNGTIDEDVVYATYCEDKDADGHGVSGGKTKQDCGPRDGFGVCDNDCDDANPNVYPGATEQCNYKDDNCNNRVDEDARASCGTGWCRRSSESCSANLCTPGDPVAEECNALDDDCDGVVDDGDLCPRGQTCSDGVCAPTGTVRDAGTSDASARDASAGDAAVRDGGAVTPATSGSKSGCALADAQGGWLLALALSLRRLTRRFAAKVVRSAPSPCPYASTIRKGLPPPAE